jgi:polyhydroxyalkanoate synthesis regulator phasin
MYSEADGKTRQAIVADLFGRYTREAEQIMTAKIVPAQAVEPAPLKKKTELQKVKVPKEEPVSEDSHSDPKRKPLMAKARLAHPFADSDQEALALYINDVNNSQEDELDKLDHEEDSLERRVDNIEDQLQQLLHKTVNECGGTGVVASKKQAKDPRYSMSLTKDVRPGQINKSLKAFDLAEANFTYPANPASVAKQKATVNRPASTSNDEVKTFAGQGYTIKFKPNVAEIYHGANLVYSKAGNYANPTRAQLGVMRSRVTDLVNRKITSIKEDLAWVKSRLGEGAVDELTARHIEYINQDIDAIKQRISTEKLPQQYVEKLKQKIASLEAERSKLAFNPK